jgi:anti-anti-sigma factor
VSSHEPRPATGTSAGTTSHQIDIDLGTDDDGRKVLIVSGDIDLQTSPTLLRVIRTTAEPGEPLVIDLRHVRFMDSPGLGTLIYSDRLQRERGGHLVLKNPRGPVNELFEVVHLAGLIEVE